MTAIFEQDHGAGMNVESQVWRCATCQCFHLRTGKVLLTFTPAEFDSFIQGVVDCYCGEIMRGGMNESQIFS